MWSRICRASCRNHRGALRSAASLLRYFGSGAVAWDAVCAGDLSLLQGSIVRADEEHVTLPRAWRCCIVLAAVALDIAELLLSRGARVYACDSTVPLHCTMRACPVTPISELLLSNERTSS